MLLADANVERPASNPIIIECEFIVPLNVSYAASTPARSPTIKLWNGVTFNFELCDIFEFQE